MPPLLVGDLVLLSSGGPLMTVSNADNVTDSVHGFVTCIWFDREGASHADVFPRASLIKVDTGHREVQ